MRISPNSRIISLAYGSAVRSERLREGFQRIRRCEEGNEVRDQQLEMLFNEGRDFYWKGSAFFSHTSLNSTEKSVRCVSSGCRRQ